MKKVLSLVLVIAMVLSSMSFAFASTSFNDVVDTDYEDAINTLVSLGVITGYEDGTFRPEKTVTRAEMAKMLVITLGFGDLVAGSKSNFSDTQGHWADAYIALAAGKGIVIGTGSGKFAPDKTVSYDEALTMLVRGLGYTDTCNELKNMTWPTNFKVKAAEVGVTNGVKLSAAGADRGGIAALINNALKATLVTVDTDGNVTSLRDSATVAGIPGDLKPLLSRLAEKKGTEASPYEVTANKVDPKHRDYAGDKVDLKPYMYQGLQVYVNKNNDKEVIYVVKSYSDVVTGTLKANNDGNPTTGTDAVKNVANGKINVKLADKSTKKLDFNTSGSAVTVFYNGKEILLTENEIETGITAKTINLKDAAVTAIVKDNKILKLVAEKATVGDQATREYKTGTLKLGKILLPKNGDDVDLSKVTVTGAVDDIKDIKADDIVIAYAAQGNDNREVPSSVKLVVSREKIEGKITDINGDRDVVTIGGKDYDVSAVPGVVALNVGEEGTFFLDNNKKVFASDTTTASSAKDYAVVIQTLAGEKRVAGDRITLKPEIKLINAKGEVVTYEVSTSAVYQNGGITSATKVLNSTGSGATIDLTFNQDGIKTLQSTSLVKYKLDSDNKISRVEIVAEKALVNTGKAKSNVDTKDSKFDVATDAPIFYINPNATGATALADKANYSVVAASDLPGQIDFTYYELNDSGAYKVIVSSDAARGSGTFALITAVGETQNSDKDVVTKITAYVDGKKVVYEAKIKDLVVTPSAINKGNIVSLTLSNGKVDAGVASTPLGRPHEKAEILNAIEARMQIKAADGTKTWFELDSNVAIYIINSKDEFVSVGEISDLNGSEVVGLYNVYNTSGNTIDIIVIR